VDLVLKGRGVRISDQIRQAAEHKLGRIERLGGGVRRVEVEVFEEHNPRVGSQGTHHVEISAATRRTTVRAAGSGHDVESAIDQAVDRLERQISTYRSKLFDRLTGRKNRLKSPRTSQYGSSSSE